MTPEAASKAATDNRVRLQESVECSCYYCLSVYDADEIHRWVDGGETALCGRCGVDAVVPGRFDEKTLADWQRHWFSREK